MHTTILAIPHGYEEWFYFLEFLTPRDIAGKYRWYNNAFKYTALLAIQMMQMTLFLNGWTSTTSEGCRWGHEFLFVSSTFFHIVWQDSIVMSLVELIINPISIYTWQWASKIPLGNSVIAISINTIKTYKFAQLSSIISIFKLSD